MLILFGLLLATSYRVQAVDIFRDNEVTAIEEKECHGTFVGFGYSGSLEHHYNNLRKRYEGCTYVHGNLEITNLVDPNIQYDLSFLKDIRYVSGYVLIGLVTEVPVISLSNLHIVRGNKTYPVLGGEYSFIVALTSRYKNSSIGLKQLHLPMLEEISNGQVIFSQNPNLCYVDTINWDVITRGHHKSVKYGEDAIAEKCSECICEGEGRCWGPEEDLCQKVSPIACDASCPARCFGTQPENCCHHACAVGCVGPTDKDCVVCKDYELYGHCVDFCPSGTYTMFQDCVKITST